MAGDRSLAFAMAGMIGAMALWVCRGNLEPHRAQPPSIYSVVAAVSRGVRRDMNLEAAVKANAAHVARTLKDQPQISALHVVSAYYSMTTGHVTFF